MNNLLSPLNNSLTPLNNLLTPWYTYDDDRGDVNMSQFSIARDQKQNGTFTETYYKNRTVHVVRKRRRSCCAVCCVLSLCCVIADCLMHTADSVSLLDPLLLPLPLSLSPPLPLSPSLNFSPPLPPGTLTFIKRAQAAGFRPRQVEARQVEGDEEEGDEEEGDEEEGGPYIQAYMDYPPDWMLRGSLPDDTDIDPKYGYMIYYNGLYNIL